MMPAMFFVYEVLLYLVFLIALPWFLLVGIVRGKYLANFRERMGSYRTPASAHELWIHAVSVGETLAARPVVDEIRLRRPATSIVFTTTTITGQAQAKKLFPDVTVTYFPLDFAASVKRFLAHHEPRVFATMETEIWPNATRLSRARGMRLLLANGRISDRSFPRYRLMRPFVAPVLRQYDRILVREETDRERFIAIGAPAAIVETSGNVKFDFTPVQGALEIAPQLAKVIAGRKVLVLGSTMQGEDEALIAGFATFIESNNAFVIMAPRKPERFEPVASMLAAAGLRVVRRSRWSDAAADVLLLDTFGELAAIYDFASVAFIGGSLVPTGGHNPIEAAAAGVPVCFGPHMSNFREIARTFLAGGGAVEVGSATDVFSFAARMFDDVAAQRSTGERGRQTVEQNRGAAARTAARIIELLP